MTMKLYAVLGATLAMTLISTSAQAACPTAFSSSTYTCSGSTLGDICVKGDEDYIRGGLGGDYLEGGDEDDEITGEAGIDTNDGGDHDDGDECENDGANDCEGFMTLDSLCPW
jgi:Ca2+-binding RTX toxin-like protein